MQGIHSSGKNVSYLENRKLHRGAERTEVFRRKESIVVPLVLDSFESR